MIKEEFFNTVTLQTRSLVELAGVQVEKSFDLDKLKNIMSNEEFAKIGKVIITGCGDSYSAAGSMRAVFAELSGIEDTFSPDPMNFTAFYSDEDIKSVKSEEESSTLVIAVSASGGSERIQLILEKGKVGGAKTMLLTNNPESKNSLVADLTFVLDTPPLNDVPGVRSYLASMTGIVALGAHIGVCKKNKTIEEFNEIKAAIVDYINTCADYYPAIEELALETGKAWKDLRKFEAIGDDTNYFTSLFVEQTLIECSGYQCTHTDSEDWSHVNIFLKEPETIGTIIHAFQDQPSFSRLIETTNSAAKLGRPILLVTDAKDVEVESSVKVSLMPRPPQKYQWLSTLYNYVPGSLVSGYLASVVGKFFFGGRYDYNKQEWLVSFDDGGKKDE